MTHNHPDGLDGGVMASELVWLARNGGSKHDIRTRIGEVYKVDFTLDEIRPTYSFNETCQGSVPQAVVAFLESESFEDAIRNAISIGGDSDTIVAITGSIAEAFYGVPEEMKERARSYLDSRLLGILDAFDEMIGYGYAAAETDLCARCLHVDHSACTNISAEDRLCNARNK